MLKSLGCAAFAGLLAAACSGGDPGALKFTVPWDSGPTGIQPSTVGEAGVPAVVPVDSATPVVDAGPPPAPSPFPTAGYASATIAGDDTAFKKHQNTPKKPIELTDDRRAENCLRCHASGGDAADKPFAFGGFASEKKTESIPLKDAEIWVTDEAGMSRVKTQTDDNGFFWLPKSAVTFVPAYVALRKGTTTQVMKQKLLTSGGACNDCHKAGQFGLVFLSDT